MVYRIFGAPVRAATGEVNSSLVGKTVAIVIRDTTTPFPIIDGASDPIPGSNLIVESGHVVSPFGFESDTPTSVYLDWYIEETGDRGQIWFEEVLRQIATDAQGAVQSVNGLTPDANGSVTIDLGGTFDHGALSGLADDDHTQYDTAARSLARHYSKEETAGLVANAVSAARPALLDRGNHTGSQTISTVINLESRLAALEAGGGGGSAGILLIPEGDDVPLGTPPGLVGYIPGGVGPTPTLVETISYDSEGTTATCAVPTGVAIGDAVVFIAGFDPTATGGDMSVSDAGWTEIIDYSANHTRDSAAFVYRVTDSTALSALGATVTANYGQTGRRMGVCFVIPGSLVASAWPAYTSGSNRSAATINSNTTTGCSIQGFATATVPFHKVALFVMHDAAATPVASSGFTEVAYATGSAGGAEARTLTVLIKDLAAAPIPAATVTHATAATSVHGGGQFIVPVA